jgi:hypothetical protein
MSNYYIAVCIIIFLKISLIAVLMGWNYATVEKNTLTAKQKNIVWKVVIPLLLLSIFFLFVLDSKYQISGVGNLVTVGGYFLVLSSVARKFKDKWNLAKKFYIASNICIGAAPLYVIYFASTENKVSLFEDVPATSLSVAVIAVMILGEVLGNTPE